MNRRRMSDLPMKAEVSGSALNVRFVPEADMSPTTPIGMATTLHHEMHMNPGKQLRVLLRALGFQLDGDILDRLAARLLPRE